MSRLQGELAFKEGQATVNNLLRSIATELTASEWTVLNRTSDPDVPWTFDLVRSIKVPRIGKKADVKLLRVLAKTFVKPTTNPFGQIEVLQANTTGQNQTCIITLNGETLQITVPNGRTRKEIAKLIADRIKESFDIFGETAIDKDNENLVVIKGAGTVRALEVNSTTTKTGLAFLFEIKNDSRVAELRIAGNVLENGAITLKINNKNVVVNLTGANTTDGLPEVSEKLFINAINAGTAQHGFTAELKDAEQHLIIVKHSTDDIATLTAEEGIIFNEPFVTKSRVANNLFFITCRTSIIRQETNFSLMIDGTQFSNISLLPGDGLEAIRDKIRARLSSSNFDVGLTGSDIRISRNTGSINTASCSADRTIPGSGKANILLNVKPNVLASNKIKIKVFGQAFNYTNGIIQIDSNTIPYTIPEKATKAKVQEILIQALMSKYTNVSAIDGETIEVISENSPFATVSITGAAELTGKGLITGHTISQPDNFAGVVVVQQGLNTDTTVRIRINNNVYEVPLTGTQTKVQIAKAIQQVIIKEKNYETSTVDGNEVTIINTAERINSCKVDYVEIDPQYYDVKGNVILGLKNGAAGTQVGDNVIIQIKDPGELFCFSTFVEQEIQGQLATIADLVSRPKGKIKVFEAKVREIKLEQAQKKNSGESIYSVNGTNLSKRMKSTTAPGTPTWDVQVFRGEDAANANALTLIPSTEYIVDYDLGLIFFDIDPLKAHPTEKLFVTYAALEANYEKVIDETKYQIYNDKLVALDQSLKNMDIVVTAVFKWDLVYPSSVFSFEEGQKRMLIKTLVDISQTKNRSTFNEYFLEFMFDDDVALGTTGVNVRFGTAISQGAAPTLLEDKSSSWSRLAWYKSKSQAELNLKSDMSVMFFMNYTCEYLNLVIQGSAAYDKDYTNYIIAPLMFGVLEKYEGAIYTEDTYNTYFTVGGDIISDPKSKWGDNTATGVTDISVDGTISRVPYQAHYPSFHTTPEFMKKHYVNVSTETAAEQVSEVIIYHPVEKARGKIQGVLVGDRSTIEHLGTLIESRDQFDLSGALLNEDKTLRNDCGGPNKSKQKTYIQINTNAPYSLFNNSPNAFFGMCIRKA